MKLNIKTCVGWLILSSIPLHNAAADNSTNKAQEKHGFNASKKAIHTSTSVAIKKRRPVRKAVYIPPLRGAPTNRVGGGTRGGGEDFSIQTLSPNHTGITITQQPNLYYTLRNKANALIEFILISEDSEEPLIETHITPSSDAIQKIDLSSFNVKLAPEKKYLWYVTIILDVNNRAKDIVSGGEIQYEKPSNHLIELLAKSDQASLVNIFAESGVWYDAIDTTQKIPNGLVQLNDLLVQVGLNHVK